MDRAPEETLLRVFPDQAAAVLDAGPGFLRGDRGLGRQVESRHGRVAITLPDEGHGAVVFELDDDVSIQVREAGAEGEAMLVGRSVAYRIADGTSFWTAAHGGVEEWLLLDAGGVRRGAPVATWDIDGGSLEERDGAIEIRDATGAARLRVTAPAAYAAGGRPVEARLAARGTRIELSVDAQGEPVLVDPLWLPAPDMTVGRSRHAAARLGNGVLVTGGVGTGRVGVNSAELYDPAEDAWSTAFTARTMVKARSDHAAIALDRDHVLVIGGDRDGAYSTYEVYDAGTGTWELQGELGLRSPVDDRPLHLFRHTATPLTTGEVLITGGGADLNGVTTHASVFRYDPATGQMTEAAPLQQPRQMHTATLLATGQVLVVGGANANVGLRSTELYDPEQGTWSPGPTMMEEAERYMHTATLLPDGRVLVVGYGPRPEIYDPSTGELDAAEPMAAANARYGHTATLLPNGCVLVTGGRLGDQSLAEAEIYDPAADAWIVVEPLRSPRAFHEATLLDDGSVLLTGGDYRGQVSAYTLVDRYTLSRLGEPCESACTCESGFCVDGVCCDTACDGGACGACSRARGAAADGTCSLLTGPACDDGNPCTRDDACVAGRCAGTNDDGATCDDGDRCTDNFCRGGSCVAEAIECKAPNECYGDGRCEASIGCVLEKKPTGTPCTGGVCIDGRCIPNNSPGDPAAEPGSAGGGDGAGGRGGDDGRAAAGGGDGAGGRDAAGGRDSAGERGDDASLPADGGGCGCRAAGAAAPGGGAAAALLMAAAAASRAARRRHRGSRRSPR